jgi:hypothetical protein
VAPLQLGELRGKKSTPSVGWEVSVRPQRLVSGRKKEGRQLRESSPSLSSPFVVMVFLMSD